jgi:hypothetical protein
VHEEVRLNLIQHIVKTNIFGCCSEQKTAGGTDAPLLGVSAPLPVDSEGHIPIETIGAGTSRQNAS